MGHSLLQAAYDNFIDRLKAIIHDIDAKIVHYLQNFLLFYLVAFFV